jgi:hypothetical protein
MAALLICDWPNSACTMASTASAVLVMVQYGQADACLIEEPQKEPDEQPEPPPYPAHSNDAPAPRPLHRSTPTQWGFQHRPP